MLSSDKNVESIAQLIEVLKHYLGLQKEYLKLDVIDKVVRLLTAIALVVLLFLIIIAVLLFLSLGIAFWLSNYVGLTCAFFILSGVHIVILALFIVFRKAWIERPIVRFLASLFMS